MIGLELARTLQDAGLTWTPSPGDHFVIPDRGLDERVFVISTMVVETIDTASGRVLAFNGTTEWALDSIEVDEVVWLPREDQLRDVLGDSFLRLDRLDGDELTTGYAVTVRAPGAADSTARHVDVTAETAYARAVLARLTS